MDSKGVRAMVKKQPSRIREIDSQYIQQHEQNLEMQKRKRRGLVRRLVAIGIVSVLLCVFAFMTLQTQAKMLEDIQQEKIALEQKLDELHAEQEFLEQEIKNYNDEEFIAEIARRDYYMTKPGETLFKLPKSSSD
jgi:cell division protein DivIC